MDVFGEINILTVLSFQSKKLVYLHLFIFNYLSDILQLSG